MAIISQCLSPYKDGKCWYKLIRGPAVLVSPIPFITNKLQLRDLHLTVPIQGDGETEPALAGETAQLWLQWKQHTFPSSLIVLQVLSGIGRILGMDVLKPLRVKTVMHMNFAEAGTEEKKHPRSYISSIMLTFPNTAGNNFISHMISPATPPFLPLQ